MRDRPAPLVLSRLAWRPFWLKMNQKRVNQLGVAPSRSSSVTQLEVAPSRTSSVTQLRVAPSRSSSANLYSSGRHRH